MKVRIIEADGNPKKCVKCGFDGFRKSRRCKYTDIGKIKGYWYDVIKCDKCNNREEFNRIEFGY